MNADEDIQLTLPVNNDLHHLLLQYSLMGATVETLA